MIKIISIMLQILLLSWLIFLHVSSALPIESKPLNNNPESWNLGWLVFSPRNASDPSAEALIGNDPHVKKSKITPKSIFIAPNTNFDKICPMGYRIDDNGKCIKTVTVNQDDILAARLADLFGGDDDNSNKATNSDSDYYDFFEEDKNNKNENVGPLQFNIPLMIDVEEKADGSKKMEYIIEEKVITMRNLPAPQKVISEAAVTDKIVTTSSEPVTTILEEITTVTESSIKTTTLEIEETTTTEALTTTSSTTTTSTSTTPSTTTKTTTIAPIKFNNIDFMPKFTRKSNRTRVKSRPRKPRPSISTTTSSTTTTTTIAPSIIAGDLQSLQTQQIPKRNRLKSGSKRRRLSTTTMASTIPSTIKPVTHKPFYWLPKGWTIDESKKDKPVLIRFWSDQNQNQNQQQQQSISDNRARSHNSRSQRMNSKMPTENIFREVTVPELEELLSP